MQAPRIIRSGFLLCGGVAAIWVLAGFARPSPASNPGATPHTVAPVATLGGQGEDCTTCLNERTSLDWDQSITGGETGCNDLLIQAMNLSETDGTCELEVDGCEPKTDCTVSVDLQVQFPVENPCLSKVYVHGGPWYNIADPSKPMPFVNTTGWETFEASIACEASDSGSWIIGTNTIHLQVFSDEDGLDLIGQFKLSFRCWECTETH